MKWIMRFCIILLGFLITFALIGPQVGDGTSRSLSYSIPAAFAARISLLLIPIVLLVIVLTIIIERRHKR